MHRTVLRMFTVAFFALLMLGLGIIANAQFRAGIQGTVTDPQGGAVTEAMITVTNKETAKAQQVTSSGEGFYRVSSLPPGTYTVTAEKTGYSKKVLESVSVSAETTQGLDITLEVGEVTATVTVSGEGTTALQTENATIGGSISTREVLRLPQVGRDPYQLIRLAPGVFGQGAFIGQGNAVRFPNGGTGGDSGGNIFSTENRPEISAGGQRVEANNIQIDGVNAMSQNWGGSAVITPNQESVKEVRVLATNYSAENGRNTGAQIQVVSQSGANAFHGSLFFKRNTPGMNAFQRFTRAGTALRENPQRVNQFLSTYGGSIGGPIYLPRFGEGGRSYWSGKNKLFFFFSYETATRDSSRQEGQWVQTLQYANAVRNLRPNSIAATIYNFPGVIPLRIASVDSRSCGSAGFNDVGTCNQVAGGLDIGSINAAATSGVLQPGTGAGLDGIPDIQFAQLTIPDKNKSRQFNTRIDYQVTKDDLVAFSMYFVPNNNEFAWGGVGRPAYDFTSARRNTVGTLLWTRTLSSSMVNEARFNVTRWFFDEIASNPDIGWGIPKGIVCYNPGCRAWGGQDVGPGVFYQTSYNFRDTLSKVVGAHSLKFGGDFIAEQNNDTAPWAGRPTYWFGNPWSFANDAPHEQKAFFDPKTGSFTNLAAYTRSKYYAAFAQDDWKIRPNLTLNLGLRWEYYTPLRSKNGRISNLVLGPNGDLLGARIKTGGNLFNPDRNNFAPQVGFAWSPKTFFGHNIENRAVLRGGFGVGYNRLPGARLGESRFNPPFFAEFGLFLNDGNGDGITDLQYRLASDIHGFSYPANPAATLTFDPTTGLPLTGNRVGFNATQQDVPNSYAYRYSLEGEYEVGSGWIASLTYQGSKARKLPRTVPYHLFVTPHPRINRVTLMLTDAYSNFNALLFGAAHRFSKGFSFNAEYRLAKSQDTCSSDNGCTQTYPFDQSSEYGPSDFDVRHAFKAYGVWSLPVFRDRKDWVGKLAGGWELSGILTSNSGFPWTPVFRTKCRAGAGDGDCDIRPIAQIRPAATNSTSNSTFLGPGQFPGGGLTYFTAPPKCDNDPNTADPPCAAVPPRPGVGRNSLRGPGYFSVNMTALKRFGMPILGEGAGIEIRGNVYNLFNTLNLESFQADQDNTRVDHPDFGRALKVLSGRTAEIQVRLSF